MSNKWCYITVTAAMVLAILAGCHIGPDKPEVDDNGRKVYPLGKEMYDPDSSAGLAFEYIMVDGHEYLVASGFRRYGLTHSPKCLCHKELKHE